MILLLIKFVMHVELKNLNCLTLIWGYLVC